MNNTTATVGMYLKGEDEDAMYFRKPTPKPPKLIRKLKLHQVNEGIPGGLEVRYGDLTLRFHRLEGRFGKCTIVGGASDGKPFNLDAGTPLCDYGDYYEAEI